jgi:putative hydrolase of the HAD superfamily
MIFTDADNTLWDTNKVYADAQLSMLHSVETATGKNVTTTDRLKYLREFDQDIALHHHAGLRYPPAILATALALALNGAPRNVAVTSTLKQGQSILTDFPASTIENKFLEDLQVFAELRPGVLIGLEKLYKSDEPIALVTEGHKERCIEHLKHHHIRQFFSRIIESKKNADLYHRLGNLEGARQNIPVMIGDQLDRDIVPAAKAGFLTIYFPGHFIPKWTPNEITNKPSYKVKSFDDAAKIIIENRANAQRTEMNRIQAETL